MEKIKWACVIAITVISLEFGAVYASSFVTYLGSMTCYLRTTYLSPGIAWRFLQHLIANANVTVRSCCKFGGRFWIALLLLTVGGTMCLWRDRQTGTFLVLICFQARANYVPSFCQYKHLLFFLTFSPSLYTSFYQFLFYSAKYAFQSIFPSFHPCSVSSFFQSIFLFFISSLILLTPRL